MFFSWYQKKRHESEQAWRCAVRGGHKESDITERLNTNHLENQGVSHTDSPPPFGLVTCQELGSHTGPAATALDSTALDPGAHTPEVSFWVGGAECIEALRDTT